MGRGLEESAPLRAGGAAWGGEGAREGWGSRVLPSLCPKASLQRKSRSGPCRAPWGGGGSFHMLDWVPAPCSLARWDAREGRVCVRVCVHCLGVYLCARVFVGIWAHAFVCMHIRECECLCGFAASEASDSRDCGPETASEGLLTTLPSTLPAHTPRRGITPLGALL